MLEKITPPRIGQIGAPPLACHVVVIFYGIGG